MWDEDHITELNEEIELNELRKIVKDLAETDLLVRVWGNTYECKACKKISKYGDKIKHLDTCIKRRALNWKNEEDRPKQVSEPEDLGVYEFQIGLLKKEPKLVRNMTDPESRSFWEKLESRIKGFDKTAPEWLKTEIPENTKTDMPSALFDIPKRYWPNDGKDVWASIHDYLKKQKPV